MKHFKLISRMLVLVQIVAGLVLVFLLVKAIMMLVSMNGV